MILTSLFIFLCAYLVWLLIRRFYGKTALWVEFMLTYSENYWKRKWLSAHKNNRKVEYNNIDLYHPQRGWTLAPNLKNKAFKDFFVSSNSSGSRGIQEVSKDKPTVLFLGDSFCFGEGVGDQHTIPYIFGQAAGGFESVNLGVHGYGIDQQYLYLKDALAKFKPAVVCFIINFDDFNRCFLSFRDYAKPRFYQDKGGFKLANQTVPEPEYYLKSAKNISTFVLFFDLLRCILIHYGIIGKKSRIKLCAYVLDRIKQAVEEAGSRLFFVYVPNFYGPLYGNYVNNFFRGYFKSRGIEYLDLLDVFSRKKLLSVTDSRTGHFIAIGNEMIARELSVRLTKGAS